MVVVTQSMSGCRIVSSMQVTTPSEKPFSVPEHSGAIAAGMSLHPPPGFGDHDAELRLPRRPAELLPDLAARGDQRRRVSEPPGGFYGLDLAPRHLADGPYHFFDREASAVAQVVDPVLSLLRRPPAGSF